MSSVYFFLVAEASAISSAPNTMSRGTFFSRASTSTSITNSVPALSVAATFPHNWAVPASPARHRQRERTSVPRVQLSPLRRRAARPQPAPPVVRRAHAHVGRCAGEAREIGRLAQRPVSPAEDTSIRS
jgi:hypothetical protein